ncbi:MAG: metallophosphoesterase [Verrucomicrobiota bacterium]|jgi:predicted MPP superfamily phosphohydrolase
MIKILTATDLHRSGALLKELQGAVGKHKPHIVALVGDFLHAFDDDARRLTTRQCAELLAQLPCAEIVFVRGNHEDEAWYEFAEVWARSGRPLHALHGEPPNLAAIRFAHGFGRLRQHQIPRYFLQGAFRSLTQKAEAASNKFCGPRGGGGLQDPLRR